MQVFSLSRDSGTSAKAFPDIQAGSRRRPLPENLPILPQDEYKTQGTGEEGRCIVYRELSARKRQKNGRGRRDRRVAEQDYKPDWMG
jgi:hypothetical protein